MNSECFMRSWGHYDCNTYLPRVGNLRSNCGDNFGGLQRIEIAIVLDLNFGNLKIVNAFKLSPSSNMALNCCDN